MFKALIRRWRFIKARRFISKQEATLQGLLSKDPDPVGRYMTQHLIAQEISMWISLGKRVDQGEFDWVCDRRGFSHNWQHFLYRTLLAIGLAGRLKPVWPRR